jgi:hypothetical protein
MLLNGKSLPCLQAGYCFSPTHYILLPTLVHLEARTIVPVWYDAYLIIYVC